MDRWIKAQKGGHISKSEKGEATSIPFCSSSSFIHNGILLLNLLNSSNKIWEQKRERERFSIVMKQPEELTRRGIQYPIGWQKPFHMLNPPLPSLPSVPSCMCVCVCTFDCEFAHTDYRSRGTQRGVVFDGLWLVRWTPEREARAEKYPHMWI